MNIQATDSAYKWWVSPTISPLLPLYYRTNNQEGKFLVRFDLDLLGYGSNQIRGVDFTKVTVKLDFFREAPEPYTYETDIFTEFDAVVVIGDNRYTSVSF